MIRSWPTAVETTRALADRLAASLVEATATVNVVLPGGSTPARLYDLLAQEPYRSAIPWTRARWVLSDERCVPPNHEDSNFNMVWQRLLGPVGVAPEAVVRFRGEMKPEKAVELANAELAGWERSHSLFDLVLLGVGEDGHTASLFPEERPPEWGTYPAAAVFHSDRGHRITLVPKALSRTRGMWFFALGETKAPAILRTHETIEATPMVPITQLHPPRAEWFLDSAAAALLPEGS